MKAAVYITKILKLILFFFNINVISYKITNISIKVDITLINASSIASETLEIRT